MVGQGSAHQYVTALFSQFGKCSNWLVPACANDAHMGSEPWHRFLGRFSPPPCLMTNTDLLPHLIALHFIKRGIMNAQLLISKEFPPPGIGSLSSGSETHFFPSLINFLLLLWQAPLYISFGSACFPSSGRRHSLVGGRTGDRGAVQGPAALRVNPTSL